MKKILILLGLITLSISAYYFLKDNQIPVFLMTEEPDIIAKGHNGQVFLVELHFEHDGLIDFIESNHSQNVLFLLDSSLIERADHIVELLKKLQRPTGLLGKNSETLDQDIVIYEEAFDNKPLWFMPQGYIYEESLRLTLFEQQVNMIAPSLIIRNNVFPTKLEKGTILSLPLYKETNVDFEKLSSWMSQQKFISIEESLFGYSIKTKRYP
ncbi:MAG: hypothetical protein ACI33M_14295 [Lysinibacillus sp.]